eukprot:3046758-Rhodomonas_salina.2
MRPIAAARSSSLRHPVPVTQYQVIKNTSGGSHIVASGNMQALQRSRGSRRTRFKMTAHINCYNDTQQLYRIQYEQWYVRAKTSTDKIHFRHPENPRLRLHSRVCDVPVCYASKDIARTRVSDLDSERRCAVFINTQVPRYRYPGTRCQYRLPAHQRTRYTLPSGDFRLPHPSNPPFRSRCHAPSAGGPRPVLVLCL